MIGRMSQVAAADAHRAFELEAVIVALEQAAKHAWAVGLGVHFMSEVEHLRATAAANRLSRPRLAARR